MGLDVIKYKERDKISSVSVSHHYPYIAGLQSKFKGIKSKFRITSGIQTKRNRKKKSSSFWYHFIGFVCLISEPMQ